MNRNDAILLNHENVTWPKFEAVPEPRVITGTPETATILVAESPQSQLGLWQVTPGSFSTDHAGYIEFIHILAGVGRLVSDTGVVTELSAGSTTVMPVAWKGRWEIDATLTKVFTILKSEDDEFTVHGSTISESTK